VILNDINWVDFYSEIKKPFIKTHLLNFISLN